jgi:hypothetical protein
MCGESLSLQQFASKFTRGNNCSDKFRPCLSTAFTHMHIPYFCHTKPPPHQILHLLLANKSHNIGYTPFASNFSKYSIDFISVINSYPSPCKPTHPIILSKKSPKKSSTKVTKNPTYQKNAIPEPRHPARYLRIDREFVCIQLRSTSA